MGGDLAEPEPPHSWCMEFDDLIPSVELGGALLPSQPFAAPVESPVAPFSSAAFAAASAASVRHTAAASALCGGAGSRCSGTAGADQCAL